MQIQSVILFKVQRSQEVVVYFVLGGVSSADWAFGRSRLKISNLHFLRCQL
jgi:hypothetical protein